jgi:AcrR family transcriptional regulator
MEGTKPGRRERNRNEQRRRILEAAIRLFSDRGVAKVKVTDVATAAGVSRATVFNHFGAKHALVEGIAQEVIDYFGQMLTNALADTKTPTPILVRALFEETGAAIEEDRRFYRDVFQEVAKVRLSLDRGGPGQRATWEALALLGRLFARGQERGEISRHYRPAELASAFESLANGTLTHWLYADAEGSLRNRMRRAAEVLLGPVAIERARPRKAPRPPIVPPRGRRRVPSAPGRPRRG